MSCKHIKHLQIYKEVVALVLINHVCLGFIFTFSNQLIEYALECLYPCYDLNTENSGLVSLLLSDFSGSMRFDMAYSMSIEQSLLVASAIRLYRIVFCLATSGIFVSCLRSSNIGTTSRYVVGFGICGVVFNGFMDLNADIYAGSLKCTT